MTDHSDNNTGTAGLTGLAVLSSAIRKIFGIVLVSVICSIAMPVGVSAQESVSDQLKRLRRDLEDIQAYVYRSTNVPTGTGATSTGPRDSDAMALLQRQMLELEGQVRDLTGQIERVRYDIRVTSDRLDKLVGDVDLRLQALEQGGRAPVLQSSDSSTTSQPLPVQQPSVQTRQDGETTIISSRVVAGNQLPAGSKLLGTVNPNQVQDVRAGQVPSTTAPVSPTRDTRLPPAPVAAPGPGGVVTGAAQVGALPQSGFPEGSVQEQYNYAFKFLQQRDYPAAEGALREFVDRNPSDPLAGNAMYWMGETFYVRKDFPEAARVFLDAYQRFPKGNKAADNLFKLARSLSEIGENASACTTYGELLKSFPKANDRILSSVRGDMARLNCP